MGNKRKVALVIVLSVVVSAVAVFAAVGESLRRFNVSNQPPVDAAAYTGDTFTVTSAQTATFPSSVYMILFSGSNGGGTSAANYGAVGGYGATCLAFFKGSSNTITIATGGTGGSFSYDLKHDDGNTLDVRGTSGAGGNAVGVTSNFAKPNSSNSNETVIAGGGGGGITFTRNYRYSSSDHANALSGRKDAGFRSADDLWNYNYPSAFGEVATQSQNGLAGKLNGSRNNMDSSYAKTASNRYMNAQIYEPQKIEGDDDYTSGNACGGGGGAGYRNGGAGAWTNGSFTPGHGCGGGGSCSPQCYPVYTWDSRLGAASSAGARAVFYNIKPVASKQPKNTSKVYDGTSISLTAGSNALYTPANVIGASVGITTCWVYRTSTDNGGSWSAWSTEIPSRIAVGTTKVQCKYVLYGSANTGSIGPSYNMAYTSAATAAGSSNYTIDELTVDLTVSNVGTAQITTEPTVVTNRYYTAQNVASFVNNAGAGSLIKTNGTNGGAATMYFRLLNSSGNVVQNWTTSTGAITATNIGTYYVQAQARGTGYNNSNTLEWTVTISRANQTLTKPKLHANFTYSGASPTALITAAGSLSGEGTIYYFITKEGGGTGETETPANNGKPSFSTSTWKTNITDTNLKRANVGTYTVWACALGKGSGTSGAPTQTASYTHYNDVPVTKVGTVTINPCGIILNNSAFSLNNNNISPYSPGNLQRLIKSAATISPSESGTIYYFVTKNGGGTGETTTPTSGTPTFSTSTWKTDIADAGLQRTEPGTYTVWLNVVPKNQNYVYNGGICNAGSIEISRSRLSVASPVCNENLFYNGTWQQLLYSAPDSHPNGTVKYKTYYSTNGTNWVEDAVYTNTQWSSINGYDALKWRIEYWVEAADTVHYVDSEHKFVYPEIKKAAATWAIEPIGVNTVSMPSTKQQLFSLPGRVVETPVGVPCGTPYYRIISGPGIYAAGDWESDPLNVRAIEMGANSVGPYVLGYYIKGNENHYDSQPVQINAKISAGNPTFTAPQAKVDLKYNGSPRVLVEDASVNGGQAYYRWKKDSDADYGAWGPSLPTETNAGTYEIEYYIHGLDGFADIRPNGNAINHGSPIVVTIEQGSVQDPDINPIGKTDLYYNGNAQELLLRGGVIGNHPDAKSISYRVKKPDGNYDKTLDGADSDGWVTVQKEALSSETAGWHDVTGVDAGAYLIEVRVDAVNSNYASKLMSPISVSINKLTPAVNCVMGSNATYDGENHVIISNEPTLNVGNNLDGVNLEFAITKDTTDIPNSYVTWENLTTEQSDAGVYRLWANLTLTPGSAADKNLLVTQSNIQLGTVEILKATPTISCNLVSDLPYNGAPQTLITAAGINCATECGGELKFSINTTDAAGSMYSFGDEHLKVTNKGSYYIYGQITGCNPNYNDVEAHKIGVVVINQLTPEINVSLVPDWTYDNVAHSILTAEPVTNLSGLNDAKVYYAIKTGENPDEPEITDADTWYEYSADNFSKIDVGKYHVWYKVTQNATSDVDNTLNVVNKGVTKIGAVTIAKAAAPTLNSAGSLKGAVQSSVDALSLVNFEPTLNPEWRTGHTKLIPYYMVVDNTPTVPDVNDINWTTWDGLPEKTASGKYYFYYKIVSDHEDNIPSVEPKYLGMVEIVQYGATLTTPPTAHNETYNAGYINLVTEGIVEHGILQYSWKKGDGAWSEWSETRPNGVSDGEEATTAGTYYVRYYVLGTDGYADIGSTSEPKDTITVNIEKKTIGAPIAPTGSENNYYNGTGHALLATGGELNNNQLQDHFEYQLKQGETVIVDWTANAAEIQAIAVGNYLINWRVIPVDEENYKNYVGEVIPVSIGKAQITVESHAKLNETLPYKTEDGYGVRQGLIKDGTVVLNPANSGTVLFAVTAENSKPAANATDTWYACDSDALKREGSPAGTTYYVWCKVDANPEYSASYLSVEPYNIGTVTITAQHATYTAPSAANLTYNGESQGLVAGAVVDANSRIWYQYKLSTAESYGPWQETVPSMTYAATYDVRYYVEGLNGYLGVGSEDEPIGPIVVTIEKATPVVTGNGSFNTTWTYQADTARQLIAEGITLEPVDSGRIYYFITNTDNAPAYDDSNRNEDFASLTRTEGGRYYGWYYVEGNSNYNNINVTRMGAVTIAPANIKVTKSADKASTMVYNGESRTLITRDATIEPVDSGTTYYAITTSPSDAVPVDWDICSWAEYGSENLQVVNAGTYYIWFKVGTNNALNYNDVAPMKLGSVEIEKQVLNVETAPTVVTRTYNGQAQSLFATAGVVGDALNNIAKIQYRISKELGNPVDGVWVDSIEHVSLQKAPFGRYEVQYRYVLAENITETNRNNYTDSEPVTLTVNINQGSAVIQSEASAITELKYEDEYQKLINGATAEHAKAILYRVKNLTTGEFMIPCEEDGTPVNSRYDNDGEVNENGYWTSDVNAVRARDIGNYIVEYYALGADGYNNSTIFRVENIKIERNSIEVITPATGKTIKYTGEAQELVQNAAVTAANRGTPMYSLDGSDFVPDHTSLVATEVGNYTIYWYVNGGNHYYNTEIYSFTAKIERATATDDSLRIGTLAARTDLVYTGAPRQLFQGAGAVIGNGKIYYAVTTSPTENPGDELGSEDISSVTETDAYEGVNQYTYYLYYRAEASASYDAVPWTLVKDESGNALTAQIAKASYSISVSKNADVPYDGVAHQIFAGNPSIVSDSHTDANWVTASYTLSYTGYNGVSSTSGPTSDVTNLNTAIHAGTYVLTAVLTPRAGQDYADQIEASAATFTLATFVISQASANIGIKVAGLNYAAAVTLGDNATAKPFNQEQAIDLTIGKDNLIDYNGITTNNPNGYNQLRYAFVHGDDEPSAYTLCSTAENLNNAVKNLTADSVGTWNLWFKVEQHASMTNTVYFKAATIIVNGFSANDVELTGLTMTGANAVQQNGSIVYDGKYHSLWKSGRITPANSNLHLGKVYYASSDSASVTPSATEWKESPEDTRAYADYGTYYLWVKWDADNGANVAASTGRPYAYLEITKLSQNTPNTNFYFAGVNFKTNNFISATPTSTTGYQTYELTFKNTDQGVVNGQPTIAAYESKNPGTNLAGPDGFGTFKFGLSTSEETMTGKYYALDMPTSLTVRNAETYYLWVQWSGSKNIEGGASVYQIDAEQTKPCFQVNQLTDADTDITANIHLSGTTFVSDTSLGGHPYQYNFDFGSNSYEPVAQALFTVTNDPAVMINGSNYATALSCQYLLTPSDDEGTVRANTTDWVSTADLAKQTDVGTYYLWVKVTLNDTNVNVTKYFNLANTEIIRTSSFAQIAPTVCTNLTTDGQSFRQLINASVQVAPLVEYSLGDAYAGLGLTAEQEMDDEANHGVYTDSQGWRWTTDVNALALKAVDAGTYTIYYRGAGKDSTGNNYAMFDTQILAQYPFVIVPINTANAAINILPQAKANVYYAGRGLRADELFTDGKARIGSTDSIPLQYRWGDDTGTFYDYNDKELILTDAGTYVLYFKPNTTGLNNVNQEDTVAMFITVEINKVDVQIAAPTTMNRLTYKGADYQVFLAPGNYSLVQDGTINSEENEDNYVKVNGEKISYLGNNNCYGAMGKVQYAISSSVDIQPHSWVDEYTELKVRQVGTYYVWLRVESGANHNGHEAQCFPDNKITIVPAEETDIRLVKSIYVNQKDNQGNVFHYDGTTHNMLSSLNLVVEVLNRDNYGNPGDSYNIMPAEDRKGTLLYALTESETAPAGNNYSVATGWHTSWQTLSKSQAGDYYLWVRFVKNESNISTHNVCLSNLLDEDGEQREVIRIAQAEHNDLRVSGIQGLKEMFTGTALSLGNRKLAVGDLSVKVANSRYDLADEIDWDEVRYFFWNVTENNGQRPTIADYDWTEKNETGAIKVGQYQLYVKLALLTQNIEDVDLIYPVFVTPDTLIENPIYCAEITRADEHYITVEAPVWFNNLIYNGTEQRLIESPAEVVMQNGNALIGDNGTAYYRISGSSSAITTAGTTLPVGATAEDEWYSDYSSVDTKLKQQHAGTYYIWVKFDQGVSHTAIEPRYIGAVTIAQAAENGISLSDMELTQGVAYNGNLYSLVSHAVTQRFSRTGVELKKGTDYEEIYYAYSNDPLIVPALDDESIWKREANLTELKAREAGKYYIWVKVVGIENPNTHTVNVADYYRCYYYNAPEKNDFAEIDAATLMNDYFKGINPHRGLSYIARNQILADITPNAEGKLTIKIASADINTNEYNDKIIVKWGLGNGEGRGINSPLAPSLWVDSLDDINIMGKDARTYYLWIKVTGSKNLEEYVACYAPITIDKATIEYTVQPGYYGDANDNLIYIGDYQTLIKSDPVIKFKPDYSSGYYDAEYYDATGVTIQYGINTPALGLFNYQEVVGLNATNYDIYYGVFETTNWYSKVECVNVTIEKRDASDWSYGLSAVPYAKEGLEYNESEQDLITYGRLVNSLPVMGRGSALEGSVIEFWYAGENDNHDAKYRYYYNKTSGVYEWENGEKLPGRIDAGTYYIQYVVTGTGNYKTSVVKNLQIEITKRRIWWYRNPEAIYGLKYSGESQTAIKEGRLYAGNKLLEDGEMPRGVTVKYTIKAPGLSNREWSSRIPTVNSIGLWDIYYYVEVDANNEFIGSENNSPLLGTLVQVLVERFVLTIRTAPESGYLMYTAAPQDLITYKSLSTDYTTVFAEADLPYFIYSFNRELDEKDWSRGNIQAVNRGEYTIYYKLIYKPAIFELVGDIEPEGEVTAKIQAMTFQRDSIRALYNEETKKLSIDMSEYTEAMRREIMNHIKYEYRMHDEYNPSTVWREWFNEETRSGDKVIPRTELSLGTYQFRVIIQGGTNGNFYPYTQEGVEVAYEEIAITEDRVLYLEMPENTYSNAAYVRAWIDFTGTMLYEEAPEGFKHEAWVNVVDPLFYVFRGVNTTGRNGSAVVRVQTVNSGYYYRSTDDNYLSAAYRKGKAIDWEEEEEYIYRYQGLPEVEMTIRLYEVYHVQYEANGAEILSNAVAPEEGWKWHGVDYLLAENVYEKKSGEERLMANGWNTSRSGDGNNYPNGSYYRENATQVFYANFFSAEEEYYEIEWIITDGVKTYRKARNSGKWYDAGEDGERESGEFVKRGALITLPKTTVDENGNEFWSGTLFGGYNIKGWYAANDDWTLADGVEGDGWQNFEYTLNMRANSDITFVAVLVKRTEKGLQCDFTDDKGNVINSSGVVANGASAYMALSGMDENTIKNYQAGYDDWVTKYGNSQLKTTATGIVEFNLGPKGAVEGAGEEEVVESKDAQEYVMMFVIMGAGVISVVGMVIVYKVKRRR